MLKAMLCVALFTLASRFTTAQGNLYPTDITAGTTNVVVITNGVTTFAGTTNVMPAIWQGRGIGYSFQAYATNAGQLTWFWVRTADGTNWTDAGESRVWGHTLSVGSWITRSTNWPADWTDNHRAIKMLMVSNSAATVIISNAVWTRRY